MWADTAYRSATTNEVWCGVARRGMASANRIYHSKPRGKLMPVHIASGNSRSRVSGRRWNMSLPSRRNTIGLFSAPAPSVLKRAKAMIILANMAYNMKRGGAGLTGEVRPLEEKLG